MDLDYTADMQPVPSFADGIRALVDAMAKPSEAAEDDDPVPNARLALDRVLALHAKCPCNICSSGLQRGICNGCNDFWPCATLRVARGFSK
jgi:hypothetical protein